MKIRFRKKLCVCLTCPFLLQKGGRYHCNKEPDYGTSDYHNFVTSPLTPFCERLLEQTVMLGKGRKTIQIRFVRRKRRHGIGWVVYEQIGIGVYNSRINRLTVSQNNTLTGITITGVQQQNANQNASTGMSVIP